MKETIPSPRISTISDQKIRPASLEHVSGGLDSFETGCERPPKIGSAARSRASSAVVGRCTHTNQPNMPARNPAKAEGCLAGSLERYRRRTPIGRQPRVWMSAYGTADLEVSRMPHALGGVSRAQTISRRAEVKIKQWAGNPGFTIEQYPTDESSPTVPTPNVCSTPIRPGQRRERSAIEHMGVRVLKNLRSMKSIATPYILRILPCVTGRVGYRPQHRKQIKYFDVPAKPQDAHLPAVKVPDEGLRKGRKLH
uniref:Uncharacterized protein n=1 Tax=Coccidioides posadasii RMSCC 3488 TaxID=454284 RepID=A0A0J6FGZ1_COCPO|nr:hypothetical protein CPAG_05888 [Coccidioides posadasii RMSCC 3488]